MLIIFDLDDTLIDTKSITPIMLKKALEKMIKEGLLIDFSKGYERLLEIDKESIKGKESIKLFLKEIKAYRNFFEIGINEYYKEIPSDTKIFTLPNAKDVLAELKKNHVIAIVTIGKKIVQLKKLKKAGIDTAIFSKIVVIESEDKKPCYKEIIESNNFNIQDTIVCGDRISFDLKPAKELGCRTIQVQWGRGLNLKKDEYVDYSIKSLKEIPKIIKNWE